MADHDYFGNTDGVEVLVDGKPIPRERWMRYAVQGDDIQKAKRGEETRYGCAGNVVVRPAAESTRNTPS